MNHPFITATGNSRVFTVRPLMLLVSIVISFLLSIKIYVPVSFTAFKPFIPDI